MTAKQDAELTWAPYVLDGRIHEHYFETERYYASFPPGAVVVDVGCGDAAAGAAAHRPRLPRGGGRGGPGVRRPAQALGRPVTEAPAEALPFRHRSVDGVVFRGVLPFTDESRAFAEIARVLRPGGRVEAEYLGFGFGLRFALEGVKLSERFFGSRTLATSCSAPSPAASSRRPRDTGYVTHRRLARHYARHGFRVVSSTPSPTYLGCRSSSTTRSSGCDGSTRQAPARQAPARR
jgi:SAM-dependent methyltransferase